MKSLQKLLRYLKPYTVFAILAPLLMCLEVAMDLLQPTIMQHIIDNGIAENDNAYVIQMSILMLVTAFIGLIGGAGCTVYSSKAAVNFAADIRRDVFQKTQQFSSGNTDTYGTGKLITIVTNDVTSVQQALMMTLRIFVRGPLLFIGSVIIVWVTARELFPVLLVTIPILMAFIYFFSSRTGKLFVKVQKAMDKVNTKLQETFSGIRVIKAFNRKHHEIESFKNVNDTLTKRNMAAEQVILSLMPVMLFIVNVGVVFGMWMGAIKVDEGTMQVGVILAFINYLNIIMNGLISSSHVLMQITRSFTSANRIQQVLDTNIEIQEPVNPIHQTYVTGEVEFNQVNFSYSKNGEYVLKDISFQANPGDTIGIIGSTGSGKSTLVKLISRLYDPDTGMIRIGGKDIKEYPLRELRSLIGFVPQKATLFSGTIEENLRYGNENADIRQMENAARSAVAYEFIEKLEQEFEHELMQGATNLSGGQKQRLSMARAFIRQPKILVFDDSTSAVDALSEAAIQKTLKEQYGEATVFIISSKVSSIINADQILVIDDGRIEATGSHDELLQTSKVYREIYETQSGKGVLSDE
ncbi:MULTISPECIES: ABC transporter ATP-binding protein [unclassified Psychrobacillus]|uniref:ABC transporter ATP-binding protein n=1 Tax=unclassified Psychrobacillus TaxID=2636677 RepID=UPI00146B98B8|nr:MULTISPECIES: ABC transporter ATP-binding protein [unclassified Psychrobacillus]MCM3357579.1 ABC transporter ATP-binding protein/permease [Psychrobacillus sp. MER TA 171]NME04754.1 ABC transporter ATP-binding protein [Psychrobacillus sp. BL-248-WT-3]